MAPEVKFTAFGIPYLVEFSNTYFRHKSRSRARSRSLPNQSVPDRDSRCFSFILVDRPDSEDDTSTIASMDTASSETLAYPGENVGEGEGLFIQFATQRPGMHQKLSNTRLWRLKQRIAKAVLAAGMDPSPGNEKINPWEVPTLSRVSYGSIRSDSPSLVPDDSPGALFRGTYGQVMDALQAAGLVATPCKVSGLDEATRLGALFIANHKDGSKVEFTKLTLWA